MLFSIMRFTVAEVRTQDASAEEMRAGAVPVRLMTSTAPMHSGNPRGPEMHHL
jgi:hypothetical protein